MIRRYTAALHLALGIADIASAMFLFLLVSMIRFGPAWRESWANVGIDAVLAAFLYGLAWGAILWVQGLYRLRVRWSPRREALDVLVSTLFLAVAVFTFLFLVKLPDVSRLFLLILFPAQAILTIVSRAVIRLVFRDLRARGYHTRYVLVVGANRPAERFADRIERHPELGLQVTGHLATAHDRTSGEARTLRRPVLGDVNEIETYLHGNVIDEVVVFLAPDDAALVEPITRLCEEEGRVVRIPLLDRGLTLPGGRTEDFDGIPVLSLAYGPDRIIAMVAKRMLDIVLAIIGLIVLSPLLLLVAVVIRLREGPPALFHQVRVGLHGRLFEIVKFRTMVADAEERYDEVSASSDTKGPAFKMRQDPRVTRLGLLLRRTSIDELPQLWNVLRGDMSIVGPRPAPPREVAGYDIWHRRRLSMKPGITGLWQVEARFDDEFDNRAKLDLAYIDRWSIWLDLKIIVRTIPALVANPGH